MKNQRVTLHATILWLGYINEVVMPFNEHYLPRTLDDVQAAMGNNGALILSASIQYHGGAYISLEEGRA